ncbi:hypothetical protein PanWU01x14_133870 [Parasponia andersonii]|uniref:Uncharacterized protein n=1 Tax=Parasponia andersonii TaxID=3476 RepID=A0A2P5CQ12_PARAD|nr:hypothetical protein PanWU01x14_133870 [Parasponia andersonii]
MEIEVRCVGIEIDESLSGLGSFFTIFLNLTPSLALITVLVPDTWRQLMECPVLSFTRGEEMI